MTRAKRATARQIGRAFVVAVPALALPLLIRWAVVSGIATATEVSTLGVVYTLLAGIVIYRRARWRRLMPLLVTRRRCPGAILIILGAATAMGWALTQSGFSAQLAATMADVPGGAGGFLALSSWCSRFSAACWRAFRRSCCSGRCCFRWRTQLGINLMHYAIVAVLSMSLGLFTPPFGIGFYQACAIGRVAPDKAVHAAGRTWRRCWWRR